MTKHRSSVKKSERSVSPSARAQKYVATSMQGSAKASPPTAKSPIQVDVQPRRPPQLRRSSSEGSAYSLRHLDETSHVKAAKGRIQQSRDAEGSFLDVVVTWLGRVFGRGWRPPQPMDTILPFLLLGGDAAARNHELLYRAGVTHICNVAAQCDVHFPGKFVYIHLHLQDMASQKLARHFDHVTAFILRAKDLGGRVLVHCVAGVSRSACFVIVFLMRHCNMNLAQAYAHVKAKREIVHPNSSFRFQLAMYEIDLFEASSVLHSTDPDWDFYELNVYRQDKKRAQASHGMRKQSRARRLSVVY
ncbi:Aste57867_16439 [Aphanomyces stellatus]|uniref:Aste57867_16439 protein n=1 Tax=Aphanomyces stellatus TaxID=120398 RepID=A0A485L5F9_9STRA|nr:hypothetical protein As57867_016382 [Aphanomyces stellatus]VFT93214.1 Aste57867_16439 [Aphanomyces stellatus]